MNNDIDDALEILRKKEIKDKINSEIESSQTQEEFFNSQIKKYRQYSLNRKSNHKKMRDYYNAKQEVKTEALLALSTIATGTICFSIGQAQEIGVALDAIRDASGFMFLFTSTLSIIQLPTAIIAKQKMNELKEELFNRDKGSHLKR